MNSLQAAHKEAPAEFPQLLKTTEPDKLIVFCWACMIYLLYTGGQDEK